VQHYCNQLNIPLESYKQNSLQYFSVGTIEKPYTLCSVVKKHPSQHQKYLNDHQSLQSTLVPLTHRSSSIRACWRAICNVRDPPEIDLTIIDPFPAVLMLVGARQIQLPPQHIHGGWKEHVSRN
jgi:hypothetical protein